MKLSTGKGIQPIRNKSLTLATGKGIQPIRMKSVTLATGKGIQPIWNKSVTLTTGKVKLNKAFQYSQFAHESVANNSYGNNRNIYIVYFIIINTTVERYRLEQRNEYLYKTPFEIL